MGLLIGIIVNLILVSIPVGSSLGALFAIRPFRDDIVPIPVDMNNIIMTSVCGEFHEFVQNKAGLNYTVNSNEILPEAGSTLCMKMTTNENNTYTSNFTAPPFSVTWQYPFTIADPMSLPNETKPLMHAFPQAQLDGGVLPVALQDLAQLNLNVNWTMGPGDTDAATTSLLPLGAHGVNASVALDMYIDSDKTNAGNASAAAFEMIIIFAHFGLQDPVGFGNGSTVVMTKSLGGVDFQLFAGQNAASQNVFSWVATQSAEVFNADITPLFSSIINLDATKLEVNLPTFADFLGYVGFGTQAYNSIGNVTFSVPKLSIDVNHFGS